MPRTRPDASRSTWAFLPDGRVGPAVRVSTDGGAAPRWRGDSRELFYLDAPLTAANGTIMAVALRASGGDLTPAPPVPLFATHMFPDGFAQEYDVTADGQRFLVGTAIRDPHATGVNLVLGWDAGLNRSTPAP
jgi:hypothetical protein